MDPNETFCVNSYTLTQKFYMVTGLRRCAVIVKHLPARQDTKFIRANKSQKGLAFNQVKVSKLFGKRTERHAEVPLCVRAAV